MKLILSVLLFCSPLILVSQTTFPWNGTYGGSGVNRTYTTTVSGITMSATIVNSENTWQDASPVYFSAGSSVAGGGCSGITATNQGMLLSTDWTSNSVKTITTTITFSSPVQGPVNFKLFDVNDDGFGSWEDKIQISGTNSAAAAVNIFKVGTACVQTGGSVTGNGTTLLTFNSGQSTSCTCWGNNEINVGTTSDCISTITILYKSNVSPANYNTPKQYVVISNLTATVPTATPPSSITGTTSLCSGQTTTLTAVGGNASTQWFSGSCGGTLVGTGTTLTISPSSTITYYVRNGATACIPVSSCIPVTVTVNPSPAMTSTNSATICSGNILNLPLTSDFGTSYSWIATNNSNTTGESTTSQTSSTINNTLINTSASPQTVLYTVTPSASGCAGTAQTVSVLVNPAPIVNAGPDVSICTGTSTTLTANGATNYSWTPGGQTTSSISVNPSTTTTYTVAGTTTGCTATDAVTVTITSGAPINAGTDVNICAGSSSILSATGGATYSWNNGLGTGNNFSISPSTTTTYTVTGTDAGGCVGTDNIVVNVNPLPSVNAGLDQTICTGTSVTLNGSGASTYSWDNSVTNGIAFTPISSMTYTVIGTSLLGCTNTDQVNISISSGIIVDAGSDISICTGNSTILTASGATSYSWSPGGLTTASISVNPSTTTTYTVTGTSAGCTASDAVTVNITSGAPINAGPDITICAGATATLTASGGNSYTWDNSLGLGNNFVVTPFMTTTYSVTGTDAGGCVGTDNLVVTVNPLPTVNAGLDQMICNGTSLTLAGSGATSYSWNNGVIDGSAFTPSATTTYTLTGTSAFGCTATDQVTITLAAPPTIDAGLDVTLCPGASTTLTASGATTYSWTPGSQTSASITVNPSATTTYAVSVTDSNGCTNTDQVQVTLAPLPTINAGLDASTCIGSTTTLSATGGTSYTWNNGVTNGVAFSPSATTTYTVTGTSAAGCINSDDVTITVNTSSPVTFTASSATGCVPQTITLTNTTPSAANCVWTLSDGTILTGCSSVQVDFTQAGCFDVTLSTTLANGCQGSLTQTNLICIDPLPTAAFAQSSYTITDLENTIHFNNLSTGASTFNWYFGDESPISQVVDPIHAYQLTENGTFEVMLIAFSPAGCTDTAYSSLQYAEELVFWVPNSFTPDDNEYNQIFKPIFSSGYDPYNYNLSIYNRWGELIFESNDITIGWDGSYVSFAQIHNSQDDVYTWKIRYKIKANDEHKIAVGHVTILK